MTTVFAFTERERDLLKQLISWWVNFNGNTRQRPTVPYYDVSNSDVYVAKVPLGGIAAYTEHTGTGGEVGTGTAFNLSSAECILYQVREGGDLIPLNGFTQTVFNLSDAAIAAGTWILAVKDKGGTFFAVDTSGGGGGGGGSTPCGSVSFTTYRYRCEESIIPVGTGTSSMPVGALNEYSSLVTITHDGSGCLTKSTGVEKFVRTVSCCDLNCGSFSSGCCAGDLPEVLHVTFVTDADGSCPDMQSLNGLTIPLLHYMPGLYHTWAAEFVSGGSQWQFSFTCQPGCAGLDTACWLIGMRVYNPDTGDLELFSPVESGQVDPETDCLPLSVSTQMSEDVGLFCYSGFTLSVTVTE